MFHLWRHGEKGNARHKKPPPGHKLPEGASAYAPPGHSPTRRADQRGGVSIAALLLQGLLLHVYSCPGQSHQRRLCLLWYHESLRAYSDLWPCLTGRGRRETPHAIDQMFASCAVIHAPRRPHPTTLHSLEAIITMAILATIGGAHPWVEIAQWGHAHHQWRAAFLDRPHGIPSHETVGRVFALRAPTRLQPALTAWMSALADRAVEVIALDGNTIRRSWDRA